MKTNSLIFAGLLVGTTFSGTSAWAQGAGAPVPDGYIVQVRPGAAPAAVAKRHGLQPNFIFNKAVNGFAGFVPPGQLAKLQGDPMVASIVPDRYVHAIAKPTAGSGGTTTPPPQVVPEGVKRIAAAPTDALGYNGSGVGVAIVDTGLDLKHADLPVSSLSFFAYGKSAQDENGHGTHVGGIVGAKDNTRDVVGVAPGVKLYSVKVLNRQGSGTDSSIIAGLNWVLNNRQSDPSAPIRVANMSLGRPGSLDDNSLLRTAVQNLYNAGITVVVAAGNDCDLEVWQQVPACYPEVLSVASTTAKTGSNPYINDFNYVVEADTASYFTTDGSGVTISAPGGEAENIGRNAFGYFIDPVGILSTKLGGGTTRMSGTSMASPHVAGVVALLVQQDPLLTPEGARAKVKVGADNLAAPYDSRVSCFTWDGVQEGILHARKALYPPVAEPVTP